MAVLPDVGLSRAAQVILDDISHVAVGTSTAVESTSDTKLTAETNRLAPTSTLRQANQLVVRTFFPNADLPATTEEMGWFMNGSGSADSGELLVRALNNFVKGSQDLNITLKFTVER